MNNLYPYPARLSSKRLSIIFALFLGFSALAGLTGCEPADLGVQLTPDEGLRTVTVGVSAEGAGTKAEIDNDLVFSWTAGDKIAVWAGSEGSGQYYTSEAYTGGNTYQISLSGTRSNYAVYPAGIEVSDAATASSLKVKLPDVYDFTAVGADYSPLPMIAVNTEGADLAFKHLGGLLRVSIGYLPEGTSYVTVDLGKKINGSFPVRISNSGSYIVAGEATGGYTYTKFLVPSSGSVVLNLPVPTGTYNSIAVNAYNAAGTLLGSDTPTFSWTCNRAHGKKLTRDNFGWVYVFGVLNNASVTHEGGEAVLATEFQSYRYRGSAENGTLEQEEIPYTIQYSLTSPYNWIDSCPDWVSISSESNFLGSIDGEEVVANVVPQTGTGYPHTNNLATASPMVNFDLSTINVATGVIDPDRRSTANCYVVQAPGTYKLPLVYGNALKNGMVNEPAFHRQSGATGDAFPEYLSDHADQPVTSPFIGKSYTVADATLIWSDVENMVTNVSIDGSGENAYLTFKVPAENIRQGNAIVAVRDGSGTVLWSWHIWVTDEDMTNTKAGCNNYVFSPVNIGWNDKRTESYAQRVVFFRATQSYSGKQSNARGITQKAATIKENANNTYYQWGRKDPIRGAREGLSSKTVYCTDNQYQPKTSVGRVSVGTAIQNPHLQYTTNTAPCYWCTTHYGLLWDSSMYGNDTDGYSGTGIKTIYDPSPVGYRCPPPAAWSDFNEANFVFTDATDFSPKGRTYNISDSFFPGTGYQTASTSAFPFINGADGNCWSSTPYHLSGTISYRGLSYSATTINTSYPTNPAFGYPIRPVVDN